MAKTKISEYSVTPGNNTDINSINIDEGCSPANLNNAIRQLMSDLKDFQVGNKSSNQLATAGGGTGMSSPGSSGNVLTSDGSVWTSAAPTYVPTGGLLMWGTASAPTGYLNCDGSAVSRTTYSALYAVIGTSYGSGDGSSTFNLPDLRNKFPIGAGSTYSANSTGGSADAIVVSHTHTATDSGHTHSLTGNLSGGAATLAGGSGGNVYAGNTINTSSGSANITVASSGSSGTNANLPPYVGVYFIIKT